MMKKFIPRFVIFTLITLILTSVVNAVAAGNIVPVTRLDDQRFAITTNDLAPAACSSMSLTNTITTPGFLGIIWGTGGNDLILGRSADDLILALGGNDCIVGAGGDDAIYAGGGTDVCIGGPGTDTFDQCESQTQ